MADQWFIETKNAFGDWTPSIVVGARPTGKTAAGRAVRMRNDPVLVPEALQGQPLSVVRKFLAPDGEFVAIPDEAIAAVVEQTQ